MSSRAQQFDITLKGLTTRRGAVYGHPLDTFKIASEIKKAISSCPDDEVRHALELIGVKMARLCTNPTHADSPVDIAGYARTIPMLHDEREKRNVRNK